MAAGLYSFVIEQGTTTSFQINWKDSAGTAVDLTGYECKMQLKTDYSQSGGVTALTLTSSLQEAQTKGSGSYYLTTSGSDLTTATTEGSIGVYIGHAVTTQLTGSTYFYDLELTSVATEYRTRLLQGKINIKKQVSD